MNLLRVCLPLLIAIGPMSLRAVAEEIFLWPQGAPGSEGKTAPETVEKNDKGQRNISTVHRPSITPFLPEAGKANGAAVLVIPGGGHSKLCFDHEGTNLGEWLAERGVAAFVLKHRLAREKGSSYTITDHALPDTQRALRLIRSRAEEWSIDPARLGAIGFSAGGELVALAWMKPAAVIPEASDPLDRQDARPAFQALIYPGRSGEITPNEHTPPAFLACGEKDRKDISEGLAEVYLRFKKAGVSTELHVFADAGHGFGCYPGQTTPVAHWPERFVEWMNTKGFLQAGK